MEDVAKTSHLIRRGQTWYLRLRIPKDLLEHYKPKKEITKSLKTSDYKKAAMAVSVQKALIETDFEKIRKFKAAEILGEDLLSSYQDYELNDLVSRWVIKSKQDAQDRLAQNPDVALTANERADYETELKYDEWLARQEKNGFSEDYRHAGTEHAAAYLKNMGIPYKSDSSNFRKLAHLFSTALHSLAKERLDDYFGNPVQKQEALSFINPPTGKNKKIRDLCDEYMSNPSNNLTASTKRNYRIIFRALDEIVGENASLNQITRENLKEIRNLIIALPKNMLAKTGESSLKKAGEKAKANSLPRLAPATVNMYMHKLGALMQFAVQEGYIPTNLARNLTVEDKVKSKDKRHPFTEEDLQKIFSAPLYTGCIDDQHGYNKPGPNKPRNTRFWLPLLGLWTGMRLNEICQLYLSDITKRKDIDVIIVTAHSDQNLIDAKKLKSEASERIIPIHPELKKIGFLEYVAQLKKENHDRLFPDLKLDTRGYYSQEASKWFSRFLDNIGIKKPTVSFHSFRHNFRDALREAEVPHEASLQLGGWASEKSAQSGYGATSMKPTTLYNNVCKIKYPELDFSNLYLCNKQ